MERKGMYTINNSFFQKIVFKILTFAFKISPLKNLYLVGFKILACAEITSYLKQTKLRMRRQK